MTGKDGTPSRVSVVYQAPTRDSFVLALKDVPEVWEVATYPDVEPVYEGYVHSYQKEWSRRSHLPKGSSRTAGSRWTSRSTTSSSTLPTTT